MKLLRKLVYKFICKFPFISLKLFGQLFGLLEFNLNRNLCIAQKKALLCYLCAGNQDEKEIRHANYLHANQMLKILIDLNFCVDVCLCDSDFAYESIKNKSYDVVIGLGKNYKKICSNEKNQNAKKILFVTESHPSDVSERYEKRIEYFKKRHPSIGLKNAIVRKGYFDAEMFYLSNYIIAMTSDYNMATMRKTNSQIFQINCNIICNENFCFDKYINLDVVRQTRKKFLWFGSNGFIHKGADLAADAFGELSSFSLDFYGINPKEKQLLKKIKNPNVTDCGWINVHSHDFIEDVVIKHSFLLLPSCSEGMSTAVATCMAHGIIPIITKECGFDSCEFIIELENDSVETIKSTVVWASSMSEEKIWAMRRGAYNYAKEHFSLKAFDARFRNIIKEIVNI